MRIERPAYPGYVIVSPGVDLERLRRRFDRWRIRPLQGAGGILSDGAVEDLRELERQWQAEALAPRQRFERGTAVVVRSGLFLGKAARVVTDGGGASVVLDMHGLPGSVSMPAQCVALAG